jgi:hypothetical protein
VWHASIAVQGEYGPIAWARVGLKSRTIVRVTVIDLLAGVGQGETKRTRSDYVLHARRRLSDAELAAQTAEWCAIKAVDLAGDGIPW